MVMTSTTIAKTKTTTNTNRATTTKRQDNGQLLSKWDRRLGLHMSASVTSASVFDLTCNSCNFHFTHFFFVQCLPFIMNPTSGAIWTRLPRQFYCQMDCTSLQNIMFCIHFQQVILGLIDSIWRAVYLKQMFLVLRISF